MGINANSISADWGASVLQVSASRRQGRHMPPTECVDPETNFYKLTTYMLGHKINRPTLGNCVAIL